MSKDEFSERLNKINMVMRSITAHFVMVAEKLYNLSAIKTYYKWLQGEALTEEETKLLNVFSSMCYYEAVNPVVPNPLTPSEKND